MAKRATRQIDKAAQTTVRESASPTPNPSFVAVTDDDIARRAFELYCERGGQDGHDADDWLAAERELRATVS
jgi:Protein of unknown function (DUF2934)